MASNFSHRLKRQKHVSALNGALAPGCEPPGLYGKNSNDSQSNGGVINRMNSTPLNQGGDRVTAFFARHRNSLFCLLLAVITLCVYWQVTEHDFVSLDDGIYVSENQHVRAGLTIDSIQWAFRFTDIAYWHPLTWLSHMLDVQLFGLKPGLHHLTNLILHIFNGLLLFLILKSMTGYYWRSCFVAVLFALHPINVESVAWVAERKNVLSTFFWMLTLLTYVRYAKGPCLTRYLLTLAVFVMGLMSKPMLITLPVLLLLLDFWPLERLRFAPVDSDTGIKAILSKFKGSGISRLIFEKIPFLVLSLVSVILSILSAQSHQMMLSTYRVPLHLRFENAVVSYLGYIGKTIWPHKLAVFYPYPESVPVWLTLGTGLWLISTTFLIFYKWQRFPYLGVGWLWYIITLLPSIGIIQAGLWPAMADRWAYIPLIGIFIITAWGIPELWFRWHHRKTQLAAMAIAVISVILVVTWLQIRYWANSITLYRRALDVTIKNDVAHNNLGASLYFSGNVEESILHFIEALRIMPGYKAARDNLKTALAAYGKNKNTVASIENLLKVYPEDPTLQYILGDVYKSSGELDKAIAQYKKALANKPEFSQVIYDLAIIYATKEEYEKALYLLNKMIEIQPDRIGAYYNITAIYAKQNKKEESTRWLKKAVKKGFKNWEL
ncbi:MAG: tetratricopeptide repeat protein, partial [Planctomycetota bacterium]